MIRKRPWRPLAAVALLGAAMTCHAADPTFERLGNIVLNNSDRNFWDVQVDTASGFGFVACRTNPSQILKINLATRAKVGALTLPGLVGSVVIRRLVLDPARDYGYVAADTKPGKVFRFRLSTLTLVDALTVGVGDDTPTAAAADDQRLFLYVGLGNVRGKLVKINLATFSISGQADLPANAQYYSHLLVDRPRGAVYAVYGQHSDYANIGPLVKVSTGSLAVLSTVTWSTGGAVAIARSAALDSAGGKAYFGIYRSPFSEPSAAIVRVDLGSFAQDAMLPLNNGEHNIEALALDPAQDVGYFAFSDNGQFVSNPNKIGKFVLSSFSRAPGTITAGFATALAVDAPRGQLLGITGTNPAYVYWMNHPLFTNVDGTLYDPGEGDLRTTLIDAAQGFLYTVPYTIPSPLVKIDLRTESKVGTLAFPTDYGPVTSGVLDATRRYAYFGTSPAEGGGGSAIHRVSLDRFTGEGSLVLLVPGEEKLTRAGIHTADGFAYFATDTQPPRLIKIALDSLSRTGALTLNADEYPLRDLLIDTATNRGYVITGSNVSGSGRVVVVDLAGMTRVTAATLPDVLSDPVSAALGGGHIYTLHAGFPTSLGRLDKNTLALSTYTTLLTSAGTGPVMYDSQTQMAYFGLNPSQSFGQAPMTVQRVRGSDFSLAGSISGVGDEWNPRGMVLNPLTGKAYCALGLDEGRLMVFQVNALFPTAPTGGGVTSVTAGAISASWNAVAGAEQYTLRASTLPNNPPTAVAGSSVTTATAAVVGGLSPNTTHYLFVRAANAQGDSAYSVFGPTATWANAPGTISTTSVLHDAVGLSFGANGNPAGTTYVVERSTDGGLTFPSSFSTVSLTPTATGLSALTGYRFRARARNHGGVVTAPSNVLSVTTTLSPPAAPASAAVSGRSATTLTLTWAAAATATSYTAAASINSPAPPSPIASTVTVAGTTGTIAGLSPNTLYYLFVLAANAGGSSAYVLRGSTHTLANPPTGLSVARTEIAGVALSFAPNGNPGDTAYRVEISTDGGASYREALVTTSLTPTLGGLFPRTSYAVRVRAIQPDGSLTAPTGAVAFVTLSIPVDRPLAFPVPFNPETSDLRVLGFAAETALRILRIGGQTVREIVVDSMGAALWDGRDDSGQAVASGVYMVVGEGASGGKKVLKIAVER